MKIAALIVAAGRGTRAGGAVPKQWQMLRGETVADLTLQAFRAAPLITSVTIVLHGDDMDRRAGLEASGYRVVRGGETRAASVRNGLVALAEERPHRVLIHDVARPCVSTQVIADVIAGLDHAPGAAPALAITDALWSGSDGKVTGAVDRAGLFRAQTPQGFDYAAIRTAHDTHRGDAADDVEVARAAGLAVAIVPGDEDNLKITLSGDFARAERILRARHGH